MHGPPPYADGRAGRAVSRRPLEWTPLRRADGVTIEQAPARNNSWYLIVSDATGTCELRYASQSANALLGAGLSPEAAKAAAEAHADRYDPRV